MKNASILVGRSDFDDESFTNFIRINIFQNDVIGRPVMALYF